MRGSKFTMCTLAAGIAATMGAVSLHAQSAGSVFKDCADCPEMVVVPAGSFLMGSANPSAPQYEKPQHRVTFANAFAIGKYEITQAEWTALMMDNFSGYAGARRPVDGATWTEAQEFVRRLSAKTGKSYRLPSEAEWEYAARAGSATDYISGNDPVELPRFAWYNLNSGNTTHPVGEREANAFGLHDVIGNVYEWVQDCYVDNHNGAPTDGRAVAETAGCARVVKGGSYFSGSQNLRPSDRGRFDPQRGDVTLGFRVARTLP